METTTALIFEKRAWNDENAADFFLDSMSYVCGQKCLYCPNYDPIYKEHEK